MKIIKDRIMVGNILSDHVRKQIWHQVFTQVVNQIYNQIKQSQLDDI